MVNSIEDFEEDLSGKEKVRVMLDALKSPSILVRSTGAQNLTDLAINESEISIPILIEALKEKEWYSVRFGALEALIDVAKLSSIRLNDTQIQNLINFLNDDDDDFIAKVAECLGYHENQNSLPFLVKLLNYNKSEVKEFSALALGRLKNKTVVQDLINHLNDDRYTTLAVIKALGMILEGDSNYNVFFLLKYLKDANNTICMATANTLKKIQNKKAICSLIKSLENPNSTPESRNEIIDAIKSFPSSDIEKEIEEESKNQHELIDLSELLIHFIEYPEIRRKIEEKKKILIGQYSRLLRRTRSEIDGINAFVADTFKELSKINSKSELEIIIETIKSKYEIINKINFDNISHYQWVKNELFQELRQASDWYKLGYGALRELDQAVQKKLAQFSDEED
ncbi:MAG: HEAT repeat domain-containing protein [Candidatus Thorarchaeota archaeon]